MVTAVDQILSAPADYHKEDQALRLRFSKLSYVLSILIIPAAASLDYFVYPDQLGFFFLLRLAAVGVLACILAIHYLPLGRRHVYALSMIWVLAMNGFLSGLIYLSEGAASPYYAGLILVLLGIGVLIPLTAAETTLAAGGSTVLYVTACYLHQQRTGTQIPINMFFNNMFFLVAAGIICTISNQFTTRARLRDFALRQELDSRNRQLEELDRLKSQFFANISHELRTPLTLILSPVEDLLQRRSNLDERVRNALDLTRQNALRLLRLINDLLEVVRLEGGQMELHRTRIDLSIFVAGLVDSMRHLGDTKGLMISASGEQGPLAVDADVSRLEKVFLNLLTNAVKFTPAGGTIDTRWSVQDGQACVEVRDSGIGIPPDALPHIFDRFRQVDGSSTRQFQGVGLGLALAKELVEEHGGRLTVDSQVGRGTTFRVTLPLASAETAAEETVTATAPPDTPEPQTVETGEASAKREDPIARAMRDASRIEVTAQAAPPTFQERGAGASLILIVDDEPDMRRFLSTSLAEDHRIIDAADGVNGLRLARERKPDLMLLDMMMPGLNGLEVCSRLKSDDATRDIKIILLTARADEPTKLDALERGADDFLTKPFSTIEIKTRIRNLLRTATLQKDLRRRNVDLEETLAQLRSTESQLIQSEKMNALGSLAAGLLHEINNPLNYALAAIQLTQETADPNDADLCDSLKDIDEGMKRIRDIVTSLRTFAYPEEAGAPDTFELSEAASTSLKFAAHDLNGQAVDLVLAEGHPIRCSRTHITQVLVNLLTNAVKAVKAAPDRPGRIAIRSVAREGRLWVDVEDNGVGIDADTLSKIFDPFYTTRDVGQGMGLGLSVCHTIVKNHGGGIRAKSEPGKGTTISFDLPLASPE